MNLQLPFDDGWFVILSGEMKGRYGIDGSVWGWTFALGANAWREQTDLLAIRPYNKRQINTRSVFPYVFMWLCTWELGVGSWTWNLEGSTA